MDLRLLAERVEQMCVERGPRAGPDGFLREIDRSLDAARAGSTKSTLGVADRSRSSRAKAVGRLVEALETAQAVSESG